MNARRPAKVARGCCRRDDIAGLSPQAVVRFDRETFDRIAAMAARDGVSFAQQVRLYVEWGMMNSGDAGTPA